MRILSYKSVNVKLPLEDFAGKKRRFQVRAQVGRVATRLAAISGLWKRPHFTRWKCPSAPSAITRSVLADEGW
jgi:hypothetical protein